MSANWIEPLSVAVALGVLITSVAAWARIGWKRVQKVQTGPLVPYQSPTTQPRRAPFWQFSDLVVFVGLLFVSSGLMQSYVVPVIAPDLMESAGSASDEPQSIESADSESTSNQSEGEIVPAPVDAEPASDAEVPALTGPQMAVRLATHSLAMAAATLISVLSLVFRNRNAIAELGLVPSWSDVRMAGQAAILLIPPCMLLMSLVSLLMPYQHAVIDTLEASPQLWILALMCVTTVVVTPVVEEYAVRGLMQGSLQTILDPPESLETQVGDESSAGPSRSGWTPRHWLPNYITSGVFALLHANQGLAPIPLFVLSVGLGYLYRQTGKLMIPVLVHATLNGTTMLLLTLQLYISASSP
ncbi:MAG: CPBP family intramembrane glutamic endopeptidase [Planctomycetota bacterium]